MIKKVICAIGCGLIISVVMVQRDPAVHRALGSYCTNLFRDFLACNMNMRVKSINLFTGTITFEDVNASAAGSNDWQWHSDELILSFSLWELVPHHKVVAHMQFNEWAGKTSIHNGTFGIVPHIIKVMYGFSPDLPLLLRTMTFCNARLSGKDNEYNIDAAVSWNSLLKFTDETFLAIFNCADGTLAIGNRDSFNMLDGVINLDIPYYRNNWLVEADLRCHLPQLPQQGVNCFCSGNIKAGIGAFTVKSIDDLLQANPISLDVKNNKVVSAVINAPLNLLAAMVTRQQPNEKIQGNGLLAFTYNFYKAPYFSGNLNVSDCLFNNFSCISRGQLSFAQYNDGWRGDLSFNYTDTLGLHGAWNWLYGKPASLHLSNNVPLSNAVIEPWEIPADKISLSCRIDPQGKIKANYNGIATNKKTNQQANISGTIAVDEHEAALHGTIDDQKYDAIVWLSPVVGIKKLTCTNAHAAPINLNGKESDHRLFAGSFSLPSFIEIIEKATGLKIDGEGKINLYGIIDYPRLALKMKFCQGAIRLPYTYNCINQLEVTGSIDADRQLQLSSLTCKLYEGTIHCNKGYASFDEQWQPTFIYLPMIADHCLLNEKKDLFTSISGDLLFLKNGTEAPCLSGYLILNRSHLADTIFSGPLKNLFSPGKSGAVPAQWADMLCDLHLATEHPIHVKTSFFDTRAQAEIKLKGRLYAPEVSGSVTLDGGSVLFPYKPLQIAKGIITINGQQLDDPFIELVAKNYVKKYLVSLNVQGSLNHNEINFSSNPPLKDEQIIGLLFAGSEEESLKSIAPALVMSNVKSLLFGLESNAIVNRYLKPALKPFKYVHFIPGFIDQSGRGGMRGTLEIDINDRWRAMIQKNFNLSEDTHVELEYLLSDEISLKGIRDEHRDISGEVEMRFKF